MKKKNFPLKEVEELVNKGFSITQLAEKYSTSRPTMSKFLRENNLTTKYNQCLITCQNLNIDEIITLFNVSSTAIKARLLNNNIHLKDNSECHKIYSENIHYFDKIDSYDKAYVLGFICADGYVTNKNSLGITLGIKDKDFIYWYKEQLQSTAPIKETSTTISLVIYSKYIVDRLKSYSIVPNKSLVLNIKEVIQKANISEEFIPAVLLGYFDGDGGIYKAKTGNYCQYNCSVTGTYETCSYYKEYFGNIGFFLKRHKDEKNNYTYQIGGRNRVREGLSHLYQVTNHLSFFFKRKYNRYCELFEKS